MKKYKIFFFGVIFIPIPFIISIGILLYLYDPMQVWHKPYFRETTFFELKKHSRVQNKGIIDFYDFDSIIMGSSMMFGTSFKEAQDKLGGKWVNLSMSGSSMHDKAIILNYTLKHKKINNIIISLDWIDRIHNNNASSFEYLYDDNVVNNMKLYLNPKFVACALMWSKSAECVGDKKDYQQIMRVDDVNSFDIIDGAIDWINRNYSENITLMIQKYLNVSFYSIQHEINFDVHCKYLYENIFSIVEKYPQTNFYFIIPTHSRLTYRIKDEVYDFYKWHSITKYFIQKSEYYKNMFVYGFDDLDYADNLGNYFDFTHYNVDMNSMQIDSIKNKQHILTIDNIDNYLDTMEQKIKDYDLEPLIKIINEYKKN